MLVIFVKEKVMMGLIEVRKIASKENIADLLTKALDWKDFEHKAALILGLDDLSDPGHQPGGRQPA